MSAAAQEHAAAEYRTVYINLIAADDVKNVKLFSKMDVYVRASIVGYPRSAQTSAVDRNCGTHPRWRNGKPMEFVVDEPYLTRPGLSLRFEIKATSSLGPDKDVGHVTVPIHELFAGSQQQQEKVVEYQVLTPSGKPKGSLKFAYHFGDEYQRPKVEQAAEPVTAYPAYPPSQAGGGGGYKQYNYPPPPPPQQAAYPYGSGYPQQSGYGGYGAYPPPPPPQAAGYGGYGYPQPPKRNNNRMGMGLGLGAGLLGGLLVGDMISDASDYADGYGDAMDDMGGGGFDF